MVVLLTMPFAWSAIQALRNGWVPSGDDAVIAVRVHDSLSLHPPLTGLPSTSALYGGGIATNHPGPIEFYLLALPVKVLGLRAGMLLGAGAINLASVLLALWVVFRRAGPGVAAWASVVLAFTAYSTGSAVLTDPISSNMGGYPLICLTVLAWALAGGDHRLLPVAAIVASFAGQQHLAIVLPVALVAGWGAIGLVVNCVQRSPSRRREVWPWVGAALLVAGVLWAPVIIDQVTGSPGNISAVARFTRDSDRPTVGLQKGIHQVVRSAGWPPWVLRRNVTGFELVAPLTRIGWFSGITAILGLAALTVGGRRRCPELARLTITGLVVAAAGLLAGSSVPRSIEADRINLYRWTWALSLCITVSVGWGVGLMIRRARLTTTVVRSVRVPAVGCVAVILLTTTAVVGSVSSHGINDERRDQLVFDIDAKMSSAAIDAARASSRPVLIASDGSMAALSVAPGITAQLADASIRFQVPADQAASYGSRRAFDPSTAGSALMVVSSFGPLPAVPGHRLADAELNPDLVAAVDRLVASTRGRDLVVSERGPELLSTMLPLLAAATKDRIARMNRLPFEALTWYLTLRILSDGYLAEPDLPEADLATLVQASATRTLHVWGDDRVALYQLTIPQLRSYRPDLFP